MKRRDWAARLGQPFEFGHGSPDRLDTLHRRRRQLAEGTSGGNPRL
jgi:alkanesulfonate monooxygenase SsuD/methylene tetrahydromethanopterin reductase-like flavin-dependent oxidoreductase (luciferase family)